LRKLFSLQKSDKTITSVFNEVQHVFKTRWTALIGIGNHLGLMPTGVLSQATQL